MLEEILNPYNPISWILIALIISGSIAVIARYFTTYVKFIYPNAKYEAIGNPFITEKELSVLMQLKNLDAFKDRLNILRDYQVTGDQISTIQSSLDQNFIHTIEMMQKDSSNKMHPFYSLYLKKIDYTLVKNEIKNKLIDQNNTQSLDDAILPQTKETLTLLQNTLKENLPDIFIKLGFTDELIKALTQETPDFLIIDILFDKQILHFFNELKVPYKCDQAIHDYIKNMIDMLTIKYMFRAKQLNYPVETCKNIYLGEGKEISRWRFNEMAESTDISQLLSALDGTSYFPVLSTQTDNFTKEKSVQVFETVIHEAYLQKIKNISLRNYITIGPTIRFLVSKEFEIKNLKAIAKGIAEDIPSDYMKSYLIKEVAV